MTQHQGKFYILTGGSSGIGLGTAEYLTQQGATVGILDIKAPTSSQKLLFQECDISKAEVVNSAVSKLVAESGKELNGVINCAGIAPPKCPTLHEISDEIYSKVMDINVKGTFHVMRATIPLLLKNGGSIVNIASNAGLEGMAHMSVYCASKHAVIGLTKASAIEYAKHKIRVNAVAPAPVDTPLLWALSDNREEFQKQLIAKTPLGWIPKPIDIAKVVGFLLSDDSSAVTGSVYSVDGGWMA